jgi:hypothetical protein
MLDVIGDLALNKSFGQVTSGKEHQYVVDFNNAFMLIGLVSIPRIHIPSAQVAKTSSKTRLRQLYP